MSQNIDLFFCDEHPPDLNVQETDEIKKKDDAQILNREKYDRISPWLYFSPAKKDYICKSCKMLLPVMNFREKNSTKCTIDPVTDFGGAGAHPSRMLQRPEDSNKHLTVSKQYLGSECFNRTIKSLSFVALIFAEIFFENGL